MLHCRGHGLDPWMVTKILHATWCDQKKKEPSLLLGGMEIGVATVENSTEVSERTKNRTTT